MSLLMEHMIGLTDTAYLGRVGEVELGASALAGVYYLVIYMLGSVSEFTITNIKFEGAGKSKESFRFDEKTLDSSYVVTDLR